MLDILLAIKNNNMNKIPQYDPILMEHLRKILKNFIHKGNFVTQFNVTLEDLLEGMGVRNIAHTCTYVKKKKIPY